MRSKGWSWTLFSFCPTPKTMQSHSLDTCWHIHTIVFMMDEFYSDLVTFLDFFLTLLSGSSWEIFLLSGSSGSLSRRLLTLLSPKVWLLSTSTCTKYSTWGLVQTKLKLLTNLIKIHLNRPFLPPGTAVVSLRSTEQPVRCLHFNCCPHPDSSS